jgi:hypothetical protein
MERDSKEEEAYGGSVPKAREKNTNGSLYGERGTAAAILTSRWIVVKH